MFVCFICMYLRFWWINYFLLPRWQLASQVTRSRSITTNWKVPNYTACNMHMCASRSCQELLPDSETAVGPAIVQSRVPCATNGQHHATELKTSDNCEPRQPRKCKVLQGSNEYRALTRAEQGIQYFIQAPMGMERNGACENSIA